MILFLIIHYKNFAEVNTFCNSLLPYREYAIVITDNSGDFPIEETPCNAFLTKPDSNLGYLNGCAYGFEQWIKENQHIPDYICISNTDIEFIDGLEKLPPIDAIRDDVGCLAPKIILPNNANQNPNLLTRPSRKKISFLCSIHKHPLIGSFYMVLNQMKTRLKPRKKENKNDIIPIYAPHGCCIFLTKNYFIRKCTLSYGGFLFDEEYHIAEQVRLKKLRIFYYPKIKLIHRHHSNISKIKMVQQSRLHYDSLVWIKNTYF